MTDYARWEGKRDYSREGKPLDYPTRSRAALLATTPHLDLFNPYYYKYK